MAQLVLEAPASTRDPLAAVVVALPADPSRRVRRVPASLSRSPDFRRRYWSAGEIAARSSICTATVRKWVRERGLSAVQLGFSSRLFVDKVELWAFLKTLPKPGRKTRARVLRHRRLMQQRRMRRGV